MRRKNWSALGISVLLAMSLAACGSSQGAQTADNGEAQTQESGEAENAAVTEEEGGVGELPADLDFTVNLDGIKTAKIAAGVSVHDPSIYKADGKYYIFGSHMSTAVSDDMDLSGGRLQGEGSDLL